MISGVYYETWNPSGKRLKDLDVRYNVVYLAFANPAGDTMNSGLGFTNMEVVKNDIISLQNRSVTVMLSVGGATFPYPENFNAYEMVKLANRLGCDGIDIDW